MILRLTRNPLSYFQSYKNYFIAIYAIFLGFPVGDLVLIANFSTASLSLALQVVVTSGSLIAIIWGYVATKLYLYPEPLSPRRLVSRPVRPIILLYSLYLVPMILALIDAWTDTSAITTGSYTTYVIDNATRSSATVSGLLVGIGVAVVGVFTVYPLTALSLRRALVKDREVRRALRLIASLFGVISATLVSGFGVLAFDYSILGPANIVSVALIIGAVQVFLKPTFLKAFLGVVPSLESSPNAIHYDQIVLIHGPGNNRYAPIAKYIAEGVNQHELVIYFHDIDDPVSEELTKEGIDVTSLMVKGTLRLAPLSIIYPKKGIIEDTALLAIHQLSGEAKTLGNEGLRVILDYGEFVIRPVREFVNHLIDQRWTSPDHHLHVMMVFDSGAFQGEEASLSHLEAKIRTLDLAESRDTFSQAVGLSHNDVAGKKILFEYDPQVDYSQVYRSLLAETASNIERTVVFTRKESPLFSLARMQPGTKIFVLTSRVSYPKMESENLFLLPTYDSSLLLDALNKTIEAYAGSSFTILFDNISHFAFTIGPERTYSLVRQSLELMISDKITAVFSMNLKAHDSKVMSTFENMFDFELAWEKGSRNPEVRRKQMVVD
jgi:hypothetical protein